MATSRDWSDAFLRQAQEDLAAAVHLAQVNIAPSTTCMLLQMVFEKLGKAVELRSPHRKHTISELLSGHNVFDNKFKVLDSLPRHNNLFATNYLGQGDGAELQKIWVHVQDLAKLHPTRFGGDPKLEYPWEDPSSDTIKTPCQNLPFVRHFSHNTNGVRTKLIKLAEELVNHFSTLYP